MAAALVVAGLVFASCRACSGTDPAPAEEVTASATAISGILDVGAVAPEGDGPWLVGLAWFDPDLIDPVSLEVREEPEYWSTFEVASLPAPFTADLGAPFTGWVVLVLDVDGNGLPDTPVVGDLVGVSAELVASGTTDLVVYLEEVWER